MKYFAVANDYDTFLVNYVHLYANRFISMEKNFLLKRLIFVKILFVTCGGGRFKRMRYYFQKSSQNKLETKSYIQKKIWEYSMKYVL